MQTEAQSESNDLKEFNERDKESWIKEYESIGLKLHCLINVEEDKIRENIAHAMTLGLPEIWPSENKDKHGNVNEVEILICAGGPSLLDSFEEISQRQREGAKVVALANVARMLWENGIQPDAHVLLDAKPRNATFVLPELDCWHFISSQCDPSVFEAAKDKRVMLYHAVNNDAEFDVLHEHYTKKADESGDQRDAVWVPVQGGSTITMRAIRLFTLLGYKNFHTFGFDSCLKDEKHHAYEQPDADKHKVFRFDFEGTTYHVSPWMLAQFMEFQEFVKLFGMGINLQVHGDGLVADFIQKAYTKHEIKLEE